MNTVIDKHRQLLFKIEVPGVSSNEHGNLKGKSSVSPSFGIDKQQESREMPFKIELSRGLTKTTGNLKWETAETSCFGIDKQQESVVLQLELEKSWGFYLCLSNLKGFYSRILVDPVVSPCNKRLVRSSI